MSIEELLEQEARDYRRMMRKADISSTAAWNNYSYGSKACASASMNAINEAYNEYRESINW